MVSVRGQKLPMWANGVIAVAGVALVGFVAYVVYRSLKKKAEEREEKKTVEQAKSDLTNWQQQPANKLTYANNLSVYNTTANTIQKLLDGCEISINTEIDVIKNVIHCVKNQGDWLKLVEVFGSRPIADCGSWGFSVTNYTLGDLLKDQLDTGGLYNIDTIGYKKNGFATNSVDILNDYFRSKNIQW